MWKTVEYKIGEKYGLDAPNENAIVRFIPLMWLPADVNRDVIARIQADEQAAGTKDDAHAAEALSVRIDGLIAVIPHLVARWDLKDPETGDPLPTPKQMFAKGDMSVLRGLPSQILVDIVNEAMGYGQDDEILVPSGETDPDAGNEAAQAIPFENVRLSETPSMEAEPALS